MSPSTSYRLGEWIIHPESGELVSGKRRTRLEPRMMDVLLVLIQERGRVLSRDELIERTWQDVIVSDDSVNKAISLIRKELKDDFRSPRFIRTVPKRGYELIGPVEVVPSMSGPLPHTRIPARWKIGAVAGLVGVFLFSILLSSRSPSTTVSDPSDIRRATTLSGVEFDPALSPDGTQLAFVWVGDGTGAPYQVYLRNLDTQSIRRLSMGRAEYLGPAWHPDGIRLIATRFLDGACSLVWIDTTTGSEREFGECTENLMADAAWSPDGSMLAYSDRDPETGRTALRVVHTESGQSSRFVTHPPKGVLGDTDPVWLPDGRHIAFIRRFSGPVQDVFIVEGSTSAERRITFIQERIEGLAFDPESGLIVFAREFEGQYPLWSVSLSGSEPQRYMAIVSSLRNPAFSKKGGLLAGERWVVDADLQLVNTNGDWSSDANIGSRLTPAERGTPIATSSAFEGSPTSSSDGTLIAFVSDRSGSRQIWVSEADGKGVRKLTDMEGFEVDHPSFSPDGKRILFEAYPEGRSAIYEVSLSEGPPIRLTSGADNNRFPIYAADGHHVLFGSDRTGSWQIHCLDPVTGKVRTITHAGGLRVFPAAEDGWLYVSDPRRDGVRKVSVETGGERPWAPVPEGRMRSDWTPVNGGIVFMSLRKDTRVIARWDAGTDRIEDIMEIGYGSGVHATRDGTRVYFQELKLIDSDLVTVDAS